MIITGASSGIGEATAVRLARRKTFRLLLCGRNQTRLSRVAAECESAGTQASYLIGDLRDRNFIRQLTETCLSLAEIAAIVNSAGLGYFTSVDQVTDDQWDEIIAVNLTGTFRLCREIGSLMAKQKHGVIVNISSDADTRSFAGAVSYCASKGGVLAMSRALRLDLHPYGIKVSVISPGRVDTYFNKKKPGMRLDALKAGEVAEVVDFVINCSANIELLEIRLDSLNRIEA